MALHELDDLIVSLGIEPTPAQLQQLYAAFQRDFEGNVWLVDGLRVKVALQRSRIQGYKTYPETFVHLITRQGQGRERNFDRHRANKIHWVRCILENRHEPEVTHFRYPEADGSLRDYYWYKEGNFLVIMKKIAPDIFVITSFHIDDERNRKFYTEREKWYRLGGK